MLFYETRKQIKPILSKEGFARSENKEFVQSKKIYISPQISCFFFKVSFRYNRWLMFWIIYVILIKVCIPRRCCILNFEFLFPIFFLHPKGKKEIIKSTDNKIIIAFLKNLASRYILNLSFVEQ